MRRFAPLLALSLITLSLNAADKEDKAKWIQLFNGKDLSGWQAKIKGSDFGVNKGDTFRVEDGVIKVSYENYKGFDREFGHLFFMKKFSHYRLRVEYRFVGDQVKGGPGWAFRNSGLMLHCEDPAGMEKNQDFPTSIEVQLLGGKGEGKRTTANLCTPGTHVVMSDKLVKRHCIQSKSDTYHGDQWVTVDIEVRGDKVVRHIINKEVVIEYNKPQLDPNDRYAKKLIKGDDVSLKEGYISIQSESHPVEFRKIELLPLKGE